MFFLNLSALEFLGLLGSLSGVVLALYLLDRARRKQTVATLRFFAAAARPPERARRHRLQQPFSLLLQLLSMALLLLALAQVRCGAPERRSRDHVLILDTSAWMNARSGNARLIDRARAAARAYLRTVPAVDRVMLVRADALSTPATPFTRDRAALDRAIDRSQPGASALNIEQALTFAADAQRIQADGGDVGEIAFVGAGRVDSEAEAGSWALPPNLRVIAVGGAVENCGLRRVTARRSLENSDEWEIFVSVKNYSGRAKTVSIALWFGGAPGGSRTMVLDPQAEQSATFTERTKLAGNLDVRLSPRDMFSQDNRAILQLPAPVSLPVTVYSAEPRSLQALLEAIPGVQVTYEPMSAYDPKKLGRIVVFDQVAPPQPPPVDSIWIEPPADRSPVPVASAADRVKVLNWRSDHPLGAGLHTGDLEVEHSQLFRAGPQDVPIAIAEAGPLIVARDGKPKTVVLGFEPARSAMRYQLTTPLLMANVLRWMAPEIFRRVEVSAGPAGTVTAALETQNDPAQVKVADANGRALPFTVDGKIVRFFTAAPGVIRVLAGNQELVYSLTLPRAGDMLWNPRRVRRGLPARAAAAPPPRDFWQIFALLGGAGLLADWLLFGTGWRRRTSRPALKSETEYRKAS